MSKGPRELGDEHVKDVHRALLISLQNHSLQEFPMTVSKTVEYIRELYPEIKYAYSKFEFSIPDQESDVTLILHNGETINVNLFKIKKGAQIQQKNLGAKSFFEKYFLSKDLQDIFNSKLEKYYNEFLNELVTYKIGEDHYIQSTKELKRLVATHFPTFSSGISNEARETFLYSLRETCFELLKESYNLRSHKLQHAYNRLLMSDEITIITKYYEPVVKRRKDISVEKLDLREPDFNDIHLYKKGKNIVGVRFGQVGVTLRFKFESNPVSSIKLAVSYEIFNPTSSSVHQNYLTKKGLRNIITKHRHDVKKNDSNAVGKCHEAISYYYFLEEFQSIRQAEFNECIKLLERYYQSIKQETLEELFASTGTIIPIISDYLNAKYGSYLIEEIELVPDSYLLNKLDTGDIKLLLRVNGGNYISEKISLKAIAKKGSKITTKNPGIGTILGEDYFNIGSMQSVNDEVKEKFETYQLNRSESLEEISKELGVSLISADQMQLKQGVENLLGEALMVVTYYKDNISVCKQHSEINSEIVVSVQDPTNIQNTLYWNNWSEQLSMRAKFSKGAKHGWSSIKFTAEYKPY
ncbi:hypothetical protein ACFFGV_08620 [Pontibacillus salicampi]|uniref:Uncharacterized protein n=1 Tax=Pontibacillus salicampi TaxID=1449801 RepID=A0ABV6LMK4_9BACI